MVTRKLLIVLLVFLVLLVAIPLGMGMAMGMCPNSHSTCPSAVSACAAILGLMVLLMAGVLGTVSEATPKLPVLLLVSALERPPRASSF